MEPLTMLLIAATISAAIMFWPHIADFFATKVIPWARRNLSEETADKIASLFSWLDNKVCFIRVQLTELWQVFARVFLGGEIKVKKLSATEALETRTSYLRKDDETVVRSVEERKVSWDQIPPKIKAAMIKHNRQKASMDIKEAVREKAKEQAQKEGMEMVLEL